MKHQTTVTYLYIGSPPPPKKKRGGEGGGEIKQKWFCSATILNACIIYVLEKKISRWEEGASAI